MILPSSTNIEPIKFESYPEDSLVIREDVHDNLVKYIKERLALQGANRSQRLRRYASIDRIVAGWQKLTPEDSMRKNREDATGNPQAIAANLPIVDTHIDDMTAFFSEVFVPASGPFTSNQGSKDQVKGVMELSNKMSADMKADGYYATITSSLRTMLKYNIGGFSMMYQKPQSATFGADAEGGNRIQPIDVYNFMYDPFIKDINKLRTEGEWFAYVKVCNRFRMLKMISDGFISRGEKIIGRHEASNSGAIKVSYYKNSPGTAGINATGEDELTSHDGAASQTAMTESDWSSFGAGLDENATVEILGHELVHLFMWLNPKQMKLTTEAKSEDSLALYYIVLVDGDQIGHMEEIQKAIELPIYLTYFKTDEMLGSTKSQGEQIKPFQRHINFYMNATVAAERGNTWHQRVYDPDAFSPPTTSGETSGWIPSKSRGRDVRSIVTDLTEVADTSRNWASIDGLNGLLNKLYPAANLPAQIAGLDRAVQSQVAAVMHSATQRLTMQVRYLDAIWQNPFRLACFRNYVDNGDANLFQDLSPADVANLLNSGLGQLNREVAQAAIERLLFTLIQNPESAAQFDLPGFFQIWSLMLNSGVDLGQLIKGAGPGQQGAQAVQEQPGDSQQVQGGDPAAQALAQGGL